MVLMTTSSPIPNSSRQAAKASWASFVLIWAILIVAKQIASGLLVNLIVELVVFLLMLVGIISGIAALFGIPKHGTKGILWPALVGIILNALLMAIFITNAVGAYNQRAQEAQHGKPAPAQEP